MRKVRYTVITENRITQCYPAFIESCLLFHTTSLSHHMTGRKQQELLIVDLKSSLKILKDCPASP